jgi:hypothetical protein
VAGPDIDTGSPKDNTMTTGNWQDDPLDPHRTTEPTVVPTTGTEPEILGVPPAGTAPLPPSPPPGPGTRPPVDPLADEGTASTSDTAKHEAARVAEEGKEAARHTAETAKDEALNVAHEAGAQARGLADQVGTELRDQAGVQQGRAAEGLRSIADELQAMLRGEGGTDGTASALVQRAADRAGSAAGWLEQRDPATLLEDVKGFARRRPGAFLAIALGAGILAGRLTRGLVGHDAGSPATRGPVTAGGPGVPRHAGLAPVGGTAAVAGEPLGAAPIDGSLPGHTLSTEPPPIPPVPDPTFPPDPEPLSPPATDPTLPPDPTRAPNTPPRGPDEGFLK